MRSAKPIAYAAVLLALLSARASAQYQEDRDTEAVNEERLFYFGLGYGSDAVFSPFTVVIDEGFDILQLDGWDHRLSSHPFGASFKTVIRSMRHPFDTISQNGVSTFLTSELLPLSTRQSGGGQWLPNYQLHLVGGGMVVSGLREWYRAHGFGQPMLWSIATAATYHLLNETVENGYYRGLNLDAISDLYIFDVGGIVLFSSRSVRRFFSRKLHMRSWLQQPSIGVRDGSLENSGDYYSMQWRIPGSRQWHVFYYFGLNNLVGLTRRMESGYGVSVGAGLQARNQVFVDEEDYRKTVDLVGTAGVFLDREHSLLASLVYARANYRRLSLNVYPGVLPGRKWSPGMWGILDGGGSVHLGVSLRWLPGVSTTFN
ncbi:MAG: hypothetical protein WBW88_13115 [Rhodothermales bacterium]